MKSKLGIHINAFTVPNEILEFIRVVQPSVVKVLDFNAELLERAKLLSPGTLFVGRVYVPQQPFEDDPEGQARLFCAEHILRKLPVVGKVIDAWEGYNETGHGETIGLYARFETERVRILADHGLKSVVGNFATGTPELAAWVEFLPALYATKAAGGYLGLHEYSAPFMQWMTGRFQIDPNENQGDTGWTTLRYRKVYRYILPEDLKSLPLIITECGIDGGVRPRIGPQGGGFKDFETWNLNNGYGSYIDQLLWYDGELQKDAFVVGATIFCYGTQDPTWNTFDIQGATSAALARRLIDIPSSPNTSTGGDTDSALEELFAEASGTLTHVYRRDMRRWVWRVEHQKLLPAKVYGYSIMEVVEKLKAKLGGIQ